MNESRSEFIYRKSKDASWSRTGGLNWVNAERTVLSFVSTLIITFIIRLFIRSGVQGNETPSSKSGRCSLPLIGFGWQRRGEA